MGSDTHAVVAFRLRVPGMDGLRAADASITPAITGNTSALTIMIAETAADVILEDIQVFA